jgi:hypothetical protein
MRGHPELNWPAFDQAAGQLRAMGHEVFSPAEYDRKTFGTTEKVLESMGNDEHGHMVRFFGHQDTSIILICDGIAFLPGFEDSVGARMEFFLARFLGLECFHPDGTPYPSDEAELRVGRAICGI